MNRAAAAMASSMARATASKNQVWGGRILCSRSYSAKDVYFGVGARAAMLQGVNELSEAVKVTMGPKGRNVIIEKSCKDPKITKDGVTVAKSIEFKERAKNVGANLVKQVASATNKAAGDGTTCATVLAQAILAEGCTAVAAGVNVMDLRNGINMAVDSVITHLKGRALMISTSEEIKQVATISANGDREIGELIARAMERVGKDGVITISVGNTLHNELKVVEGMKLARGYLSPYFITDAESQKCELDYPLVLIHDKKISDMQVDYLIRILELVLKKKRALLVMAEDIEGDALAMLVLNKHHAGLKVCAIKAPGFGENRRANLEDLAILTGGQVISEDHGLNLADVQLEMLGTAKKVTISIDDTIVLHGGGDNKLIEDRCEQGFLVLLTPCFAGSFQLSSAGVVQLQEVLLRQFRRLPHRSEASSRAPMASHQFGLPHRRGDAYTSSRRLQRLGRRFQLRTTIEKSTAMFDKEKAQERLSKLSGGVAVIKVGGATEAEVGEKKDQFTDALNAAKASVEEGIVPGGGVALLYAIRELDRIKTKNSDEKVGVQIIQNALKAPACTIAANAGANGARVVGKLLEQHDLSLGYDAAKGEYVDMVKAGIIDPLKVIRTAIVDASSISVMLTTTEVAVVDVEEGKTSSGASRMPQMDDMNL